MLDYIKSLTPEAWTALATWVLVAGTLLAVWWQVSEQRRIHAYEFMMKLAAQFESLEMKKHRKELATQLLAGPLPPGTNESARQVMSFFDTVGMLMAKRMLDKTNAWFEFGFVVLRYHGALADRLASVRKEYADDTLHADFDHLYRVLLEIERQQRRTTREAARPTSGNVRQFLESERASLSDQPGVSQ